MKRMLALLMATTSAVLLSPAAFAQTMYPTPTGVIPTEVLGPSSIYPRISNPKISSSVAVSLDAALVEASGGIDLTSNGKKVTVPVKAVATVSKARLAGAMIGCSTAALGNPLAAAACAATIAGTATALKEAGLGYGACPAGSTEAYAFVCKAEAAGIPTDPAGTGYYYHSNLQDKTPKAACDKSAASWWAGNTAYHASWGYTTIITSTYGCTMRLHLASNPSSSANWQYPYNNLPVYKTNNYYQPSTLPPALPEFSADVSKALDKNPGKYNGYYDDLAKDFRANPTTFPSEANPIKADTPVRVEAPTTETTAEVTKTETRQNPDGSIDTTTTTSKEKVTPTVTGDGTLGGTQTKYPSQTITTSTTVNNITNTTTTNETTINHGDTSISTGGTGGTGETPTDYAKESTLQKVEKSLNTDEAPTMPDQDKRVTDASKKSDDDLKALRDAVATAQNADKSLWFSWVWTPPVGECQPGKAVLAGGALVNWDICPTVTNIKDVLGWLMALFGAWSIYGEIFRRND